MGLSNTALKSAGALSFFVFENPNFFTVNPRRLIVCDLYDVCFSKQVDHLWFDYAPKSHAPFFGKFCLVDKFFSFECPKYHINNTEYIPSYKLLAQGRVTLSECGRPVNSKQMDYLGFTESYVNYFIYKINFKPNSNNKRI